MTWPVEQFLHTTQGLCFTEMATQHPTANVSENLISALLGDKTHRLGSLTDPTVVLDDRTHGSFPSTAQGLASDQPPWLQALVPLYHSLAVIHASHLSALSATLNKSPPQHLRGQDHTAGKVSATGRLHFHAAFGDARAISPTVPLVP